MAQDTDQIKQIVTRFYESIKDHYPVRRVFLYGSHARGNALPDSDIDVGVVIEAADHSQRVEITSSLFHYAYKVHPALEPKCIFWDEFQQPEPASIVSDIIRTGIDLVHISP